MIRQGFTVEMEMSYESALDFAVEHGFDFVELNMDYAFERRRIDPERVGRVAGDRDIDVVVHLPYHLDPGSPHEHVREGARRELEAALDAAAAMGAEKAIFHGTSHARIEKWDRETIQGCLYDSIRRVDAHASDVGLTACVENLKTPFFDAGDFPELFDTTDAAACLDTGHAVVTGQDGGDQADLIESHGDRISHFHLNESRIEEQDEHLPLGLGQVDFESIVEALLATEWSGTCTHEVWGFDLDYVARSKRHFDRLLADRRSPNS